MQSIGRWVDKFGIKTMMFVDALTFIAVYVLYGFVVLGVSSNWLPREGVAAWMVYSLFVMDRLSMQISMVKSVYLRSIARRDDEVTATLSTGLSLDHAVTIVAAVAGGYIWSAWGSHWVFFMAAFFSLGNLVVAWRVRPEEEREQALEFRRLQEAEGNG
jgi:MFS family permease